MPLCQSELSLQKCRALMSIQVQLLRSCGMCDEARGEVEIWRRTRADLMARARVICFHTAMHNADTLSTLRSCRKADAVQCMDMQCHVRDAYHRVDVIPGHTMQRLTACGYMRLYSSVAKPQLDNSSSSGHAYCEIHVHGSDTAPGARCCLCPDQTGSFKEQRPWPRMHAHSPAAKSAPK